MGFVKLIDLPELEIAKGIIANVITTDAVTVLHIRIDEGALSPEHKHYNEQLIKSRVKM